MEELFEVLRETTEALDRADVPFVIGGGLASMAYGLRTATDDIDVFVEPRMAQRALSAIEAAGFHTWIEDPAWLYKAIKRGVDIDIIFESSGILHFGPRNFERARGVELGGVRMRIMAPEDLFVTKALAANPETPRHLFDAVTLLKRYDVDWQQIMEWADRGPRRLLTVLVYAHDAGAKVPSWVLVALIKKLPGIMVMVGSAELPQT